MRRRNTSLIGKNTQPKDSTRSDELFRSLLSSDYNETIEGTATVSKSCATFGSTKAATGTSLMSPSSFSIASGDGGMAPKEIYVLATSTLALTRGGGGIEVLDDARGPLFLFDAGCLCSWFPSVSTSSKPRLSLSPGLAMMKRSKFEIRNKE